MWPHEAKRKENNGFDVFMFIGTYKFISSQLDFLVLIQFFDNRFVTNPRLKSGHYFFHMGSMLVHFVHIDPTKGYV